MRGQPNTAVAKIVTHEEQSYIIATAWAKLVVALFIVIMLGNAVMVGMILISKREIDELQRRVEETK